MPAAVHTDPATGLKVFATKARCAPSVPTSGPASSQVPATSSPEVLPQQKDGVFDSTAQAAYAAYNSERKGVHNNVTMEHIAADTKEYCKDVFSSEVVPREALHDSCEVLVVGAGFGALILWHRLQKAGFRDVRFCETGGDVGGTWYWNRYPGVACDIEAYSYLPLLDEMGYIPKMKYASGQEIWQYCQQIAERFGFYEKALFHTKVTDTQWSAETKRWTVCTDRGDRMTARVVVLANGILTTPKLSQIDGMHGFKGPAFHTSRWDYGIDVAGMKRGEIGKQFGCGCIVFHAVYL